MRSTTFAAFTLLLIGVAVAEENDAVPRAPADPTAPTTHVESRPATALRIRSITFDGVSGELVEPSVLTANAQTFLEQFDTDPAQPDLRLLHASALESLVSRISSVYIDAGYGAVKVTVRRSALDQLRDPAGSGTLVVQIIEGRIDSVLSRPAVAGASTDHASIPAVHLRSPVGAGDPVHIDAIEEYLAVLNRNPRRRVDVAVSPGREASLLHLEYLVTQLRPWILFAEISNTGTEQLSEWREQIGFIHYDFSNADDRLALSFGTGDIETSQAFSVSYDRPFPDEPSLRWRVFGDLSEYDSSEVGLGGLQFRGKSRNVGAELQWTVHAADETFVDLFAGAHYRTVETNATFRFLSGATDFILLNGGVRLEQKRPGATTLASFQVEANLADVAGTSKRDLVRLGRTSPDPGWVVARAAFEHELDLERAWTPRNTDDPARLGGGVHMLALSGRGQCVLGNERLPANDTQAIGGLRTVRGYPEVLVAADNALSGSLEYRYHLVRGLDPADDPGTLFGQPFRGRPGPDGIPADWDLALRAFVDAGYVWHNQRFSFEEDAALIGAGIGLDLTLAENMNLAVDWGIALRDVGVVTAGSSEVHLRFTFVF